MEEKAEKLKVDKDKPKSKRNPNLSARITSITQTGYLTVEFSESMVTPTDLKALNSSALRLNLIPGPDSDPDQLSFNWTTVSFKSNRLLIKLDFVDPLQVS